MSRVLIIVRTLLCAALFAWCGWHAVRHYVEWRRIGYEEKSVAAWREAARATNGRDVGLLCLNARNISPMERSRLIAVNWELGDRAARPITPAEGIGGVRELIVSRLCDGLTRHELREAGYEKTFGNTAAEIWSTDQRARRPAEADTGLTGRDVLAMMPVLAGIVLAVLAMAGVRPRLDAALLLSLAVFAVLAVSEVSHPLLAPNGLAVYAGKAKLFLAGGIPEGFWADPRFAVYQPSYPPGLMGLAVLAYGCIGTCSDVAVQLLVPCALALVCWLGLESTTNPIRRAAVLALVLCPKAQEMSAGFYAEPFAALMIVAGLHRVTAGRERWGWLCIGLAGLFRHEGLLLAVGLALFGPSGPWRHRVFALAAAAAPGLLWQLFVHCTGAGLYDFDWLSGPSAAHLAEAGRLALAFGFERAWDVGGVLPWAVLLLLSGEPQGCGARQIRVLVFGLAVMAAGVVLLGFATTPYFTWMASTTLPRYMWLAFAPVLAGVGSLGDCACCGMRSDAVEKSGLDQ